MEHHRFVPPHESWYRNKCLPPIERTAAAPTTPHVIVGGVTLYAEHDAEGPRVPCSVCGVLCKQDSSNRCNVPGDSDKRPLRGVWCSVDCCQRGYDALFPTSRIAFERRTANFRVV